MAVPAVPSVIERIQEHLVTTLAGITTTSGSTCDIGAVMRGQFSPLESFAFPMASVIPAEATAEVRMGVLWWSFVFAIRVWTDALPTLASQRLEEFIADVHRILQVDTTRGGVAEYTLPLAVGYAYDVWTERLACADLSYHCDFKVTLADPRVGA